MTENAGVAHAGAAQPADIGGTAKLVYILYMAGVLLWITGLVGVIIAYVNKGDAPDWLKSHYRFQIRTFWIGAIFLIVGGITTFIFIGYLILLLWLVWLLVRCAVGIKQLNKREAIANPATWLFGA